MSIDSGIVATRTAAGRQELDAVTPALSARQRQMLILCDGKRSLQSLRRYFPEPGLDQEFIELQRLGYLERLPEPPMHSLAELRARVRSACARQLGDIDEAFVQRIDRTRSHAELRRLMPAILATLSAIHDTQAAQEFLQEVGPL